MLQMPQLHTASDNLIAYLTWEYRFPVSGRKQLLAQVRVQPWCGQGLGSASGKGSACEARLGFPSSIFRGCSASRGEKEEDDWAWAVVQRGCLPGWCSGQGSSEVRFQAEDYL